MTYPENIQNMIDDFSFLDDWENRYMHVIEMGKALTPLTDAERCFDNKVNGCVSQVWLVTTKKTSTQNSKTQYLFYHGDSDAHIVKGLVAIVIQIFSGRTPQDITHINAINIIEELGLSEHLSTQRSNGLHAMISRIQSDAHNMQLEKPNLLP